MLPTGTSSKESVQAVGVSVAVGGVTVGPPGVWVGTGLLVLVKTGVAVCVTEVLVDMGVFDGAFVLIGVAV